jgi:predicted phage terminase large subunit-like protein
MSAERKLREMIGTDREIAAVALLEELARRRLIDFARQTIPGFQAVRHLNHLAELLEAVDRGDLKRLCVTLHPGAGKSTLLQAFASWYLGRGPQRRIIAASAGAELSERNSRASRALFSEDSWPFEATLSQDTRSMTRWSTNDGGGMFAIGVGGLVTGWRANLIVADDLQNSAGSQGERDSLWSWFREVLTPRLEPNGAIIIVTTRWGEDDIVGRIQDSPDGKEWHVVRLPAIAEKGDAMGRHVGESLWPERWPIEELLKQKVAMGSRSFECQFQANPVPFEGNLIKGEWLQRYDVPPTSFTRVVCALDAAAKTGVRNDFSAIVKIGVAKTGYYVLDVWRAKVEFPGLLRRVKALESENPMPSAIYVEDTSNAVALIQQFRQETRLPIVPLSAKGSKESRVEGITGIIEAKKLYLPAEALWLLDFERELLAFPAGKHDDMVDALTLALTQLRKNRESGFSWAFANNSGSGSIASREQCIRVV